MIGSGTYGLTSSGRAELAQVQAQAAAWQAAFAALPPEEQVAIKVEDLMGRWPQKSEIWPFWLDLFYRRRGHEDRLLARREAWRAELSALIVGTDLALIMPGSKLMHVLLWHHVHLTGHIATLLWQMSDGDQRKITDFGNCLQELVFSMGMSEVVIAASISEHLVKYGQDLRP